MLELTSEKAGRDRQLAILQSYLNDKYLITDNDLALASESSIEDIQVNEYINAYWKFFYLTGAA